MTEINISINDLHSIVSSALERSNTKPKIAKIVAKALIKAEIDGKKGHGISRVKSYCLHAKIGKVNGNSFPKIRKEKQSILVVDASYGFAYPAFDLMITNLSKITKLNGIGLGSIINSHHFGVAGHHVEQAAEFGNLSLLFGNTPSAIIPWNGNRALLGTNPIAFGAPNKNGEHLIIDMALSKVARGNIVKSAENNEKIPNDWALDNNGNPTTDPKKALNGGLLPFGGAKGSALAVMVEVLSAVLTGSNFSYKASSMFDSKGGKPKLGQLMIMIDPTILLNINNYYERLNEFFEKLKNQPNVRIPGSKRFKLRKFAKKNGILISKKLLKEIESIK